MLFTQKFFNCLYFVNDYFESWCGFENEKENAGNNELMILNEL